MANVVKVFPAESGKILYLFPDVSYGLSLSQWGAIRAKATEQASPNLGKYSVTLDDTYELWMIFEGEDQPTDWNQWVDIVSLYVGWTTQDIEEARYRMGLSGTATEPEQPESTPIVISPSGLGRVTAYYVCLDNDGEPEEGVEVSLRPYKVIDSINRPTGIALDGAKRTSLSDSNGLAEFTNVMPGVRYAVSRGDGERFIISIPANATNPFPLSLIIG